MIGAGGVAGVVAHKCCQNSEVFRELCIASRTLSKCDALKKKLDGGKTKVTTAQVDADNTDELIALIEKFKTGYCNQCCIAISRLNHYGCLPCNESTLFGYRKL